MLLNPDVEFSVPELFLDWDRFTDEKKARQIGKLFGRLVKGIYKKDLEDITSGSGIHTYRRK